DRYAGVPGGAHHAEQFAVEERPGFGGARGLATIQVNEPRSRLPQVDFQRFGSQRQDFAPELPYVHVCRRTLPAGLVPGYLPAILHLLLDPGPLPGRLGTARLPEVQAALGRVILLEGP